jgi:beta-glucosidase-like glycosyl hydrolase
MPGVTKWRGEILVQAVGANKVPQHVLDERDRNVLLLVNRCAAAKIPEYAEETTADTSETAALLRKIGADSIVLMKNEGNILPLKKDKKVGVSDEFGDSWLIKLKDTDRRAKREDCHLPWRWVCITRCILCSYTFRWHQCPTYYSTRIHRRLLLTQRTSPHWTPSQD